MKKSILDVVHESAKDMYSVGAIDAITMKNYDALCLPVTKKLSPLEIKMIRIKEKLSQPIFALLLNTSVSTVKQWEQGDKKPSGIALKLLNLVAQKGTDILVTE
jgi:putative transcriptional regulator